MDDTIYSFRAEAKIPTRYKPNVVLLVVNDTTLTCNMYMKNELLFLIVHYYTFYVRNTFTSSPLASFSLLISHFLLGSFCDNNIPQPLFSPLEFSKFMEQVFPPQKFSAIIKLRYKLSSTRYQNVWSVMS